MPRRLSPAPVSSRVWLPAVALAVALAGCGSADDADAPAVAWAERVCASVEQGAAGIASPPATDAQNPQAAKVALADYLGRVAQALDTVAGGIRDAGLPPVDDGQRAVDNAMTTISEIRSAVESARTGVAALPETDPAAFQQALTQIGAGMAQIGNAEGPTRDLKANPALNEAFGKAPTCRKIDGATD